MLALFATTGKDQVSKYAIVGDERPRAKTISRL